MRLTKTSATTISIPAGKSEIIVFDDVLPGFGLRIRAGGKRTWIAQYRIGAKQRRVTIGSVATMDEGEARKLARTALAKAQLGTDHQLEKTEIRADASVTVGSVAEIYLIRYAADRLRPSTKDDVERYLRTHWRPLASVPLRKVTRAAVAARLGEIATSSGPYAANRARAALSSLYSWAMAEGLAESNPTVGTRKPIEEKARTRVLTSEELALIWRYAGHGDFGTIVRLLILTGQRREEVAAMRWSEIKRATKLWVIPPDRTKNGRQHDLPLSPRALALLRARPAMADRDLIFGTQGPFSGFSKAKAALDARIMEGRGSPLAPWRLHDIRRSVATGMADLGVLPHVIEAILNHVSGSKAGVAGIYNRSTYGPEMRVALLGWSRHMRLKLQSSPSSSSYIR